MGLATIHLTGLSYVLLAYLTRWISFETVSLSETLMANSISPLPGQLVLVCAVTVLAALLRRLMLY